MWARVRNITIILIIVVLFYLLITKQDFMFLQNSGNKAAEGFSNFYSQYLSSSGGPQRDDNYHLILPDTSKQLPQQLHQRISQVEPLPDYWRGNVTDRRFREGDTIRTVLSDYAAAEGLVLYWTLPRDYIVKHYFQTDSSLLDTLENISKAISSDFPQPVLAYFCPQQRAVVLTDKAQPYLLQHCVRANEVTARQAG